MHLKPSIKFSALACSSLILGACGLGEIVSPSGPGGMDSDGDGIVDAIDPNPHLANPDDADNIGDPKSRGPGRAQNLSFQCNPDARSEKTLQRLSRVEYENTLRDLLRMSTSDATSRAVMDAVKPLVSAYPSDATDKIKPFSTMDQSVTDAHAKALLTVGTEVAKQLTSSTQRIDEVLACSASKSATTSASASCIDGFIARFGKRALRHELNDGERSFYREVYGASTSTVDAQGLADVITVMLNAPDFFYRVEYGKDQVGGKAGLFKLSDYEIATRLAYQFWQSTPDDALLAAADRGELTNDGGFQKQLDRVLADPRAATGLERVTREWLGLDGLEELDKNASSKAFAAFAGDDMPNGSLKEEMIDDVTASMAYHAFKADDSLADWLESPYSFAKSPALAAIYGTPVWNGTGAPPSFPAGERAGLITRAALLATRHGTASTSPILKGVQIRERLLCDKLKPPPANFGGLLPELSENATTRTLVEETTSKTECATCHANQINPLGVPTENFDALGRVRDEQPLYDIETGTYIKSLPLNTRAVPHVTSDTDEREAANAQDLTEMIVQSGKAEKCFAQQYVRFTAARAENTATDGCELETIRSTLDGGASIKEALRRFALLPQFRQRYAPPSS